MPYPPVAGARRVRLAPSLAGLAVLAVAASPAHPQPAAGNEGVPVRSLGVVTVVGGQPTSLPTEIPATMESVTREQLGRTVNATDSEDALKYLPSLLVRKRYIGDYNHAILSSRASGTGNSARSAVYADGILLSNFLGNGVGGLGFPPRWNMVTPAEIERVDVMYGPFSAAYPGNSVGAVVVFTTRMPTGFEAHARTGYTSQPFSLYGTRDTYRAWQASASLGDRQGDLAWLLAVEHADSHGQPLTFANRLVSAGKPAAGGAPVTGAVPDLNNAGQPWWILGSGTEYRSTQDHLKLKLAYDLTPAVRASYQVGVWENRSDSDPATYLRDAGGRPVYAGTVDIAGRDYALGSADFSASRERQVHLMQGVTVKSHTRDRWDWQVDASRYDYRLDDKRQNAASGNPFPGAASGGAGTLADASGSGWRNAAARATWRPDGPDGAHVVEAGLQWDAYRLRYLTSTVAVDWLTDAAGALASDVAGNTGLRSVYLQDTWSPAPAWKTVLGLRAEDWHADHGLTRIAGASLAPYASRHERDLSPKAALAWQAAPDWVLRASAGRAVRMPTVAELYGATSSVNARYVNDPNLKPEKSWTAELTAERTLGSGSLRLTGFGEDTRDALYSQTTADPGAGVNVTRVQNVARIQTRGLEAVATANDVAWRGLDLAGSVTYADSVIRANDGFVAVPGDTVGKRQPNIPRWRATALASYRAGERWSVAFAARYSGTQYRTLDNSDTHGATYMGVSPCITTDLRLRYRLSRQWAAAVGVDNLNNERYWNFHPYPQRSYSAELNFDL